LPFPYFGGLAIRSLRPAFEPGRSGLGSCVGMMSSW
jgi:hypothetical protein